MTPRPQERDAFELFQSHFDQLLNPGHELVQLAKKIDWSRFEAALAGSYSSDMGAPAKATRLMVGLQYLKYTFNESDESVVARWVENPYWQYFCGYTHLQHQCPIHPTSMSRWRKRVGAERLLALLEETIALGKREGHVSQRDLERINVDTTVQEKNITYPTDSKLLYRAIEKMVVAARSRKLSLRQSYLRVGKRLAVQASRYAHARQYRRMRGCLRNLRTYVGRLIRDIRRKAHSMDGALATLLERADRVRQQQPARARGAVHQQGQGAQALRVRTEGGRRHDQPWELDGGGADAARQSLRRTHLGGNVERRGTCHRCGTHGCLCGQRVSRTRVRGCGQHPRGGRGVHESITRRTSATKATQRGRAQDRASEE